MIKELFHKLFPCKFKDPACKDSFLGCKCGKGEKPSAPAYQQPAWSAGIPEEQLALIRSQIGKQAGSPEEWNIASQALQGLLGYTPEQFSFPLESIQQALAAQQGIQYQDYLNQIRPIMAQQGQLDSSAYTNRIGQFLQGQQAQAYGTTADLLTQQALNNLDLQKYIPQLQLNAASGLSGLGGQRSALEQFNLQLPFQTTIPAFGNVYNQGLQLGDRQMQQANLQYQQDLQSYQQQQQQMSQLYSQLGQMGLAAGTGGLSGIGTGAGFGAGALQGLMGTSGQAQLMSQFPNYFGGYGGGFAEGAGSRFRNWKQAGLPSQSQILGFNTAQYR